MANEKITNVIIECIKDKQVQDEFRKLLEEQSQKITYELKQCDSCERTRDLDLLRLQNQEYISKINEVKNSNIELKSIIKRLEQDMANYKDKESIDKDLIEELRQNVQVLMQQLSTQEKDCEEKQYTIDSLSDRVQKLEAAITDYDSVAGNIKSVLDKYMTLGNNTKKQLSNVFRSEKPESVMVAGSQWQNIEGLWNYIQRKVIEGDTSDTVALTEMFIFFFKNYNEMFETPMYELINPSIGSKYNSDFHSILGTRTDGIIKEVNLVGYINNKTKKANKALIEV